MQVKRSFLFLLVVGLLAGFFVVAQLEISVVKAKNQVGEKEHAADARGATPPLVPVILKSVRQGTLVPASKTILTVKTEDGKYILHEVVPNNEGVVELQLASGRYLLSATGAPESLAFMVTPPRCTFTIQVSDSGELVNLSETKTPPDSERASLGIDKILAFGFGVVFVIVLIVIAFVDREPSPIAILIYRVVLALAAAGIGAVVPGMIDVNINPFIRAGGAIALFVIIYWFRPADLVSTPNAGAKPAEKPVDLPAPSGTKPSSTIETHKERLTDLSPSQSAEMFESMARFKSLTGDCVDTIFKPIEVKRRVRVAQPNAELEVFENLTNLSDRDQYKLRRHVTTDAPTDEKMLKIKAWANLEGMESEASVEVSPSRDGRVFSILIGFRGRVVGVGKNVQLRWKCKFPSAVALNEDYWVFPQSFYKNRPERLVIEAVFPTIPADIWLFAASSGDLNPMNLIGPDSTTTEAKSYFTYSISIDKPKDFYLLRWRIRDK